MQNTKDPCGTWLEAEGFHGIKLVRVQLDPGKQHMVVRFAMETLPLPGQEQSIRRLLMKHFPLCSIQVRIHCPALKQDFLDHPTAYTDYISGLLIERAPGAAPFLRTATWNLSDNILLIHTKGEAGASFLQERNCLEILSSILKELFSIELSVRAVADEPEAYDEEAARKQELEMTKAISEELKKGEETRKIRALNEERLIYGAKVSGTPCVIGDLAEDAGMVVIEGVVLTNNTRLLKGDTRLLLTFGVTDYTGSILVKAFMEPSDQAKAQLVAVDVGVRVRGECRYDTFSKEVAIMAKDIVLVPLPKRTDDEPEKRVELHMHTQMSTLDGVSSVKDLMKRAASWGQEAVAVTDHGVLQAFPEAFDTMRSLQKEGSPIKLIPGMEGYLVHDSESIVIGADDLPLDISYVVIDVETTGLHAQRDQLTEVAAVRIKDGQVIDEFSSFVDPGIPIPEKITKLTGITDDMVRGAPSADTVIRDLVAYIDGDIIAAHNASFDIGFLQAAAKRAGVILPERSVDTLPLARALLPDNKQYKLNVVCKTLGVPLKNHHRAIFDARATAMVLHKLLERAKTKGITTLRGLNIDLGLSVAAGNDSFHIILLAANDKGLFNLYQLTTMSHMNHYYRRPRMPQSLLKEHREGLIIGAACESGEVFQAILTKKTQAEIESIASFYDYLEIQPTGNNAFLVRENIIGDDEGLRDINRQIVALGERLGIPVCATCDVHFLDPEDAVFREILMNHKNFADAAFQAPLYMRTTKEMLDEFAYLGQEKAFEVVVTNTQAIARRVETPHMFPKHPRNEVTFQPTLPGAEEIIKELTFATAKRIYGDPLPEIVQKRIDKELSSIVGNGFGTLYRSAQLLVDKSISDGYLVGSRGSIGSSFVATMIGITEVNPLSPHYICPNCKHSDFEIDHSLYSCGVDLPLCHCPVCDTVYKRDGYDIPFEVFLGFEGEKVPDIDLNFSGVYQPRAQAYVKEIFGENNVFKAGTIGTLAEKKAFGEVMGYLESTGKTATYVEKERLAKGITGVKVTTGQHPGGMVVLPKEYDIHSFSPIQYPADKKDSGIITTHFDFGSLHDILVKLDILGHDDPTMIHMLERLTGVNAREIPLTDEKVMSLFLSPKALGVTPEQIGSNTGTFGVPEFGTQFVRGMLEETKPTTMDELLRISGLSHGTNVWLNNAQDMIRAGTATLKECFCTRDDIMNTLIFYGVEAKMAFTIMEIVRKGNGKRLLTKDMEKAMKEAGVSQQYIDSCYKIEYMFPRAHAAAYVMMALRVAYFKVYYPLAYYATFFTVRADEFDAALMLAPPDGLRSAMKQIDLKSEDSAKDDRLITLLELVLEMRERGFDFAPVDLYISSASEFVLENGSIRPPLNRLPGVGATAAESIVQERTQGKFLSIDDLAKRAKISRTVIDSLRLAGCLRDLAESSQMSLF